MEIKDTEMGKSSLEKNSRLLRKAIKTSRQILMKNEAFSKLNFVNVMDKMKLQCQVHKLTKNENISNISTVFKPLLINHQMI